MTPLLTMPDKHRDRARWLEKMILSPELGQLVQELSLLSTDSEPATLDRTLGNRKQLVINKGLGILSEAEMHQLLAHPNLLLDLQLEVLLSESKYWNQIEGSPQPRSVVQQSEQKLCEALKLEKERTKRPLIRAEDKRPRVTWVAWMTSIAASIALFVLLWNFFPLGGGGQPKSWGWNRSTALNRTETGSEYLLRLASLAKEWHKVKPERAQGLARRLIQFRLGCSRLILSEHPSLSADDAKWLKEACLRWASDLDQALTLIEKGKLIAGRAKANTTVDRLIHALEKRAKT